MWANIFGDKILSIHPKTPYPFTMFCVCHTFSTPGAPVLGIVHWRLSLHQVATSTRVTWRKNHGDVIQIEKLRKRKKLELWSVICFLLSDVWGVFCLADSWPKSGCFLLYAPTMAFLSRRPLIQAENTQRTARGELRTSSCGVVQQMTFSLKMALKGIQEAASLSEHALRCAIAVLDHQEAKADDIEDCLLKFNRLLSNPVPSSKVQLGGSVFQRGHFFGWMLEEDDQILEILAGGFK